VTGFQEDVHSADRARQRPYLNIDELLNLIEEPNAARCRQLLDDHRKLFERAAGATHNHQAWPGGYLDHLREAMNLARELYRALSALRPLPFALSDALLVLFLHDLEKPWRERPGAASALVLNSGSLESPDERHAFRLRAIERYGLELTAEHVNGLEFVEGEAHRWSPEHRGMGPLAALCHCCDTLSARVWFDRPSEDETDWGGRWRTPGQSSPAGD
jgi:hypothetical protein